MSQARTAMTAERAARPSAKSLPLVFGIASEASQVIDSAGMRHYLVDEWSFLYSAGPEGDSVAVAVGSMGVEVREADIKRWQFWARSPAITDWRIDSDRAQTIAIGSGGELVPSGSVFGTGVFSLRVGSVNGTPVPIWSLPYRFVSGPKYVRADTGKILVLANAEPEIFREK